METRIARLESDMDHVKRSVAAIETRVGGLQKDVGDIRVDIATVKTTVAHLPGKAFIFSVCLGLLAAIGGLTALIVRFLPHAG